MATMFVLQALELILSTEEEQGQTREMKHSEQAEEVGASTGLASPIQRHAAVSPI